MSGLRVLVVEDEGLIAMVLDDYLKDLGCTVIGPLSSLASARDALDTEEFDVALLDVNLGGQAVFPVADALIERGVDFRFVTAHDIDTLPARFHRIGSASKPYSAFDIEGAMTEMGCRRSNARPA